MKLVDTLQLSSMVRLRLVSADGTSVDPTKTRRRRKIERWLKRLGLFKDAREEILDAS